MSNKTDVNYDDIDFRLNVLYDYMYNKDTQNCYNFEPLVKSNIKISDIKQSPDYDYSEIFNAEMKYIGFYNKRLHFKRISKTSYPCTVSIGAYSNYLPINNLGIKELINPSMSYLLSDNLSEPYKMILAPIMFFDIKEIKENDFNKIPKEISQKIKENLKNIDGLYYVFITEHYFKMQTLREYLKENAQKMEQLHWKSLFFQIFYILHKLQSKFKGFRHNNLNLDSIKLYKLEEKGEFKMTIGDVNFKVPNMGFEVRITDFDHSYTEDYITGVRYFRQEKISDNPYYDIHYILNLVYLYLKENNINMDNLMPLIDDLLIDSFRIETSENFSGLDEARFDEISSVIIVPSKVLKTNNFFTEFIV